MKYEVSILKSKFDEKETILRVNETDADFLHIDVMDGHFVKEKSKTYEYLYLSKKKLYVHLMTSHPFEYINIFSLNNTECITIPLEIDDDICSLLKFIKDRGLRCGLALKPETSVEKIIPYIKELDEVLVLTVNPGKGGQELIKECIEKIDVLKKLKEERGLNFIITVDGGVNNETINLVKNADMVVTGSFVCMHDDFQKQLDLLK